ncbi:MAG: hypothetical protein HY235_21430 [Acidobacteria bacterium]|nr:hypothetical protein [Acidobacteriota bacterium]
MRFVAPPGSTSVLVVTSRLEDYQQLLVMLSPRDWQVRHAKTWREAGEALRRGPCSVVVTDSQLEDASWRDVLGWLADECPEHTPRLVVADAAADDYLWSEVLNLGGYNVLAKPFDETEVCWVLDPGALAWDEEHANADAVLVH